MTSIYYDGYWIRYYEPPAESLLARKRLIESLTRRTFHHTEPGINTPGENLELARAVYERETDPRRKRVNGAMLAGALFNRATDIFREVVDLTTKGVQISQENELMRECADCFEEALEIGKCVRHYSGEEGIDELWGEPFKAFTMPLEQFYNSRYIKIAQAMRSIDLIIDRMKSIFSAREEFAGVVPLLEELCDAAKREAETMRSDEVIFEVWPRYVAASDAIGEYQPEVDDADMSDAGFRRVYDGLQLLREGKNVITYLSGARVPMPKTTADFLARCDEYDTHGYTPRHIRE
ncbi:MAG: hypothetical protein U5R46_02420 [Gammaproteobacteria bacterium]|nr:hypothetical protein [Gammaproteobacteria bacterium]